MPLATRRDIGQLLFGSFKGTSIPVEWRSLAREFDLGGAVLFSRNVEVPEQVAELAADVEGLGRAMPTWVSIDQEGGRVALLKEPFTRWPPMATLGRAGSEKLAERFERCGLNVDVAAANEHAIATRLDRLHRGIGHGYLRAHGFHLEVVAKDHAFVAELFTQDLLNDERRQRRNPFGVERRHVHVRGHDEGHTLANRGAKWLELHGPQPIGRMLDERHL